MLLFLFVILMIGGFDDLFHIALIEVAMPLVVSAGVIVIKAGLNAKLAISAIALESCSVLSASLFGFISLKG